MFLNVRKQVFYIPGQTIGEETIAGSNIISYEDTVLFMMSNFQYVLTAIAFSVAKPFRKPIYTNTPFVISIVIILLMNTYIVFTPNRDVDLQNTNGDNWIVNFFLLEPFLDNGQSYYSYRFQLFGAIVLNSIVTLCFEKIFITKITSLYD